MFVRYRSRRWRVRASVCGGVGRGGDGVRALCARAVAGAGCPFFRRASGRWHASLRAPAVVAGFLWGTLAMHQEAGPSVQMMRVRFCLEAAEKPSYPAAYGILAMRMWSFVVLFILRCVASPYDGPTGNVSPWSRPRACSMGRRAARRARGGVPSAWGGLPHCQPPSKQKRLGKPARTMTTFARAMNLSREFPG